MEIKPYFADYEEKQKQEAEKTENLVAFLVLLASAIFLAAWTVII